MFVSAKMTEDEMSELKKNNEKVFFRSSYDFLKIHKGLRPGLTHLVIGMPSGGKSTLRDSLIFDFLNHNPGKNVLLWLSEEAANSFKMKVANNKEFNGMMDRVFIYSERDNKNIGGNNQVLIDRIAEGVMKSNASLFILDNITTSELYKGGYEQQDYTADQLKGIFEGTQCPLVIFAHTSSNIKQGHSAIIDMTDIRGSRGLVNIAEYMYILQSFVLDKNMFTTVRLAKHRDQNVSEKMYALNYNQEKRFYDVDVKIDFEHFKKLYKKQNKF